MTAANPVIERPASLALAWTESGLLPDALIRAGIRHLNRRRLAEIEASDLQRSADRLNRFVREMNASEIAPLPRLANQQHYEVPAEFFAQVLGGHGKYSCAWWGEGVSSLDEAESDALSITCRRARLEDGQDVLELGCGWGSLSLWMAGRYRNSRITSVSNSAPQRRWIEARARERGLTNLRVLTCDMNHFETDEQFDRVVSVEMFEHMRNYDELYRRISSWLRPDGLFFKHIFCHRQAAYAFEDRGPSDWMSRHFFSGGIMPSFDLPLHFQRNLQLEERHAWSGTHYARTANAWLANLDQRREQVLPILAGTYGPAAARQWLQRWRIFFMACAELFGQYGGQQWLVGHYVFSNRRAR